MKRRLTERQGISFKKVDGMTKQSDKDRCNINTIMSKFANTGLIDYVNQKQPIYDDVSNLPTFQEAQDARILSKEIYDSLPDKIKKEWTYEQLATEEFTVEQLEELQEDSHSPNDTSGQIEDAPNET